MDNIISDIVSKVESRMEREKYPVTVNISNRHIHLSLPDLEILFGKDYQLRKKRDLVQHGQFASEEQVKIVGPKNFIERVRVLGPLRNQTQVEVSRTDSYILGINPPVRESGVLVNSAPLKVIGPKGEIELKEGLIIALRHIHMTLQDANKLNLSDKEIVRIKFDGERGGILNNVVVRVREDFVLECHIDTDEGNALGINNGDKIYIL